MKTAILFSGGKDSVYAAYLTKQQGNELTCLITIHSENPDSYMFHTPSIEKTKVQAEVMDLPLIVHNTKGEKEKELVDLEDAIKEAIDQYKIQAIVTGALHSEYQASRIQKICDKLNIKCLNPLWHKDEAGYLNELIENKFKVIIIGVAAYPLDSTWLNKEINEQFIKEVQNLEIPIHIAGEGGEFETFVLDCPLFKKPLEVIDKKISGENNSWRMDINVS